MINVNTFQNALEHMPINLAYYQITAAFWNHLSILKKAFLLSHIQTEWRNTVYDFTVDTTDVRYKEKNK